jgi:hypothetical protein
MPPSISLLRRLFVHESAETSDEDARLALLLDEVKRGIQQQQEDLDNLRSRAGTLVATASLVSSFLGAVTLRDTHLPIPAVVCTVIALAAFVVVLGCASFIWLPYTWRWGIDGWAILRDYIEPADSEPVSLDELRRSLAWHMQDDMNSNRSKLDHLFIALRIAVVAIGLEVGAWMLALWTR